MLAVLAWLHKPASESSSVLYGLELLVSDEHNPADRLVASCCNCRSELAAACFHAMHDCNFIESAAEQQQVCLCNAALP